MEPKVHPPGGGETDGTRLARGIGNPIHPMTTKQNKKPLSSAPPAAAEVEDITIGSEDDGAEVANAAERSTVPDDYTANARVGDSPEEQSEDIDFTDEQDQADRPDTAAMFDEEGDEES